MPKLQEQQKLGQKKDKKTLTSKELDVDNENVERYLTDVFKGNYELITFALMQVKSDKYHSAVKFPLFRYVLNGNFNSILCGVPQ